MANMCLISFILRCSSENTTIRRPFQIGGKPSNQFVPDLEWSPYGLDRDKRIVKHDPTDLIGIGKAYSLYLHDLHSFHQKSDVDMRFHEEQQGFLPVHCLHCEWVCFLI